MEHPTEGNLKVLGIPIKFNKTPGTYRYYPPLVGEHTEEVLNKVGYSQEDIEQLKKMEVVQ